MILETVRDAAKIALTWLLKCLLLFPLYFFFFLKTCHNGRKFCGNDFDGFCSILFINEKFKCELVKIF